MITCKVSNHGAELQSLQKDRYLNHALQPGETFAFTYWIEIQ